MEVFCRPAWGNVRAGKYAAMLPLAAMDPLPESQRVRCLFLMMSCCVPCLFTVMGGSIRTTIGEPLRVEVQGASICMAGVSERAGTSLLRQPGTSPSMLQGLSRVCSLVTAVETPIACSHIICSTACLTCQLPVAAGGSAALRAMLWHAWKSHRNTPAADAAHCHIGSGR